MTYVRAEVAKNIKNAAAGDFYNKMDNLNVENTSNNINTEWLSYSYYGVILILLFCIFGLPAFLHILWPDFEKINFLTKLLLSFLPHSVLICALILFTSHKFDSNTPLYKKLQLINWKMSYLSIGICIALLIFPLNVLISLVTLFLFKFFSLPITQPKIISFFLKANGLQLSILFIFSVFIAPVIEEIVFRRIIFEYLRLKMGFLNSFILTSITFALIHMNTIQFPGLLLLGLVLQFLYVYYRSLYPAIFFHMANNCCSIGLLIVLKYN